jgi:hypothetical protein
MNVEIGTETPIFLFWEYLFRNFGILSLQCAHFLRLLLSNLTLIFILNFMAFNSESALQLFK